MDALNPGFVVPPTIPGSGRTILTREAAGNGDTWLEQNKEKSGSPWAALARNGHAVFHRVRGGRYVGEIRIDGRAMTYEHARREFLATARRT